MQSIYSKAMSRTNAIPHAKRALKPSGMSREKKSFHLFLSFYSRNEERFKGDLGYSPEYVSILSLTLNTNMKIA